MAGLDPAIPLGNACLRWMKSPGAEVTMPAFTVADESW
jgi:hypothetical protein